MDARTEHDGDDVLLDKANGLIERVHGLYDALEEHARELGGMSLTESERSAYEKGLAEIYLDLSFTADGVTAFEFRFRNLTAWKKSDRTIFEITPKYDRDVH